MTLRVEGWRKRVGSASTQAGYGSGGGESDGSRVTKNRGGGGIPGNALVVA